jgi:hypothetical protein
MYAIVSARDEVEITPISQELQLLPNFWLHIVVSRIQIAQLFFKSVYVLDLKFGLSDRFNAFHDFDQPSSSGLRFIA